jgi:AraC family transcriptional regulator, transcriptional activator FtrA
MHHDTREPHLRAPGEHVRRTRALLVPGTLAPALYVLAVLLVPLLVGVANVGLKLATLPDDAPARFDAPLPAPSPHDSTRRTAVVLASAHGAEINDFLMTYEILARSQAVNVYAVAPEHELLPLYNANRTARHIGLDVVPHYSFAEYDARVGRAPDLIAIPYFPGYAPQRDAAVLDWVRTHRGPQTLILSVCGGIEPLLDTGLLGAGSTVTHVDWFEGLEARFPEVRFRRGVRFTEDGPFITSTNLAASIDATLHAVGRLAGRGVAEDVARQLGYRRTGYLDDPSFRPAPTAVPRMLAHAAYQWGWQELGVVLYDGVGEVALAALVDPYTTTLAARTHTLAPERGVITSQHGLALVPRYDFETAPRLDRVVLPGSAAPEATRQAGAAWARARWGLPLDEIHASVGAGEFAYDATLRDIARTRGSELALIAADVLFVPADHLQLESTAGRLQLLVPPLALGLIGAGLLLALPGRGRRARPASASA